MSIWPSDIEDAARAIGVQVGQIVKSLVFTLDGRMVMALVSGCNRLDEARLAATLGGQEVGRADAAGVRAATGYAIGGVPPFGHPTPLPTVIDEDLLTHDEVWAAAGIANSASQSAATRRTIMLASSRPGIAAAWGRF